MRYPDLERRIAPSETKRYAIQIPWEVVEDRQDGRVVLRAPLIVNVFYEGGRAREDFGREIPRRTVIDLRDP